MLLIDDEQHLPEDPPLRFSDRRVEPLLGALVIFVVGLLLAMIISVFLRGWPSFAHNGLSWFGAQGKPRGSAQHDLPLRRGRGPTTSTPFTPGRFSGARC